MQAFRNIAAEQVSVANWDQLSSLLVKERIEEAACQTYPTKVAGGLQGMGLSWEEWGTLRQIADVSNALVYTGESAELGYTASMARLKTNTVPAHLHHTSEGLGVHEEQLMLHG